MKLVSRSLPLRLPACSHLTARLPPFSTNTTRSSISSPLNLTHHYSIIATMPPQPKRKWHRPRGDRANGAANGSAPSTPSTPGTPRTALTQQPKRPKVEDAMPTAEGTVDVKQMYSTSAGDASAKPFSELSGKLDKALLEGLDKMGFE
jgi:hypothetical protein